MILKRKHVCFKEVGTHPHYEILKGSGEFDFDTMLTKKELKRTEKTLSEYQDILALIDRKRVEWLKELEKQRYELKQKKEVV